MFVDADTYCNDNEHHLGDVKSVSPVVVGHIPVVLLDTQKPPTEGVVVDVEAL